MSYKSLPLVVLLFCAVFMCFAQNQPVELTAQVGSTFRFAFLGDTRFTNPKDTRDSNATVRQTLVQAIADARPAFVSIGGDIVYHGDDANDWKTWDVETAIWHKHGIAMYLVEVEHRKLNVTMNRLQMERGKPNWTRPDTATISVPTVTTAAAAPAN